MKLELTSKECIELLTFLNRKLHLGENYDGFDNEDHVNNTLVNVYDKLAIYVSELIDTRDIDDKLSKHQAWERKQKEKLEMQDNEPDELDRDMILLVDEDDEADEDYPRRKKRSKRRKRRHRR